MYEDVAFERGVTAHRPFTGDDTNPSTGWHAAFEDVNNDGLWDLFVAKGNVDAMPDMALQDPNNLLLGNEDGTFTEAADRAGLLSFKRGRGAAVVDLNRDGQLDVVVANRGDNAQVWRNVSEEKGNFLAVRFARTRAATVTGWGVGSSFAPPLTPSPAKSPWAAVMRAGHWALFISAWARRRGRNCGCAGPAAR